MSISTKVLLLALPLALSALSGCRIGNQVKYAQSPYAVNYYSTEAKALSFCTSAKGCADIPAEFIPGWLPGEISQVMTNPVMLVQDVNTKDAAIASSKDSKHNLPVTLSEDGTLFFLGSTNAEILWLYDGCTKRYRVMQSGKTEKLTNPDKGTSGRMQLEFTMVMEIAGECAQSLQEMRDCYIDAMACPGADNREKLLVQDYVLNHFEIYVGSGAIAPEDIATLSSTSYKVSYQ